MKRLSRRSDALGVRRLAAHAGLIALAMAGVLAARRSIWLLPAMAVLGVLEVTLFAPLHETTHRTPFRSRALNRLVGVVAGFVLVLPPVRFRLYHLTHHQYAQDPARDPELIGTEPLTRRSYWFKLSGVPYWLSEIRMLIATAGGATGESWIPDTQRTAVVREARLYLAAYALLLIGGVVTQSALPLMFWIGPVLLGQPVLRYALMAEHTGCPFNNDVYTNTRTTLAGPLVRLLHWNMNYHAEHHLAPSVPFHALPALHEEVKRSLCQIDASYAIAHKGIRAGLAG